MESPLLVVASFRGLTKLWEREFIITGLLLYNTSHFITVLNGLWDVNSWVRFNHENHEHDKAQLIMISQ